MDAARAAGKDPSDFAIDLSLESGLKARFRTAAANYDEAEVSELLADEHVVVALSDAGAHANQLCDACYATHLLGHWVREAGVLELAQAVHKLTGRPADLLGVSDRGRLKVGFAADVVVFDPTTVGAGPLKRVNDLPAGADRLQSEAIGISAVVVNGTLLRQDGVDQVDSAGALPGRLLRFGSTGVSR